MSVAEETYHAYMFILRNHVKSYGGSDKADADTNKTEKQDGQEYGQKDEMKKAADKMDDPKIGKSAAKAPNPIAAKVNQAKAAIKK